MTERKAMFVKLTPEERTEREAALAELDLQVVRLDREKRLWMEEHKEVRKPIEAKRLEICEELESGRRWVDPQIAMPFSGFAGPDPDDLPSPREAQPELQTQKRKRGRSKKSAIEEALEIAE